MIGTHCGADMASDVYQWPPGMTRPGYLPRALSAYVETRMVENPSNDPFVSLLCVGLHSTMLGSRKGGAVSRSVRRAHELQLGRAARLRSSLDEHGTA